jgi:hypothetical protein
MNVRFEGNNGRDADVMRCLLMTQACGDPSSLLQVTLSPGCMVIELGLNAKFAIDTLAPPPASAERLAPPCTTSLRGLTDGDGPFKANSAWRDSDVSF